MQKAHAITLRHYTQRYELSDEQKKRKEKKENYLEKNEGKKGRSGVAVFPLEATEIIFLRITVTGID